MHARVRSNSTPSGLAIAPSLLIPFGVFQRARVTPSGDAVTGNSALPGGPAVVAQLDSLSRNA